jgi:hypothetical protein
MPTPDLEVSLISTRARARARAHTHTHTHTHTDEYFPLELIFLPFKVIPDGYFSLIFAHMDY